MDPIYQKAMNKALEDIITQEAVVVFSGDAPSEEMELIRESRFELTQTGGRLVTTYKEVISPKNSTLGDINDITEMTKCFPEYVPRDDLTEIISLDLAALRPEHLCKPGFVVADAGEGPQAVDQYNIYITAESVETVEDTTPFQVAKHAKEYKDGVPTHYALFQDYDFSTAIETLQQLQGVGIEAAVEGGIFPVDWTKQSVKYGFGDDFGKVVSQAMGRGKSVELANILLGLLSSEISPGQEDYLAGASTLPKLITTSTASECVGTLNGRVYKLSRDEETIQKEVYLLRILQQNSRVAGRIARLTTELDELHMDPVTQAMTGPFRAEEQRTSALERLASKLAPVIVEPQELVQSLSRGYLSFNGMHILITESEEVVARQSFGDVAVHKVTARQRAVQDKKHGRFQGKLDAWSEWMAHQHYQETLGKLAQSLDQQDIFVLDVDLMGNQLIKRLYTLAALHATRLPQVGIVPKAYADFSLQDLTSGVPVQRSTLSGYVDASQRQQTQYHERATDETLVLTHGDAKWDNWLNESRVLIDFGSAKFSTEYKDIAKALLDSAHHFHVTPEKRYLDHLPGTTLSENQKAFLKKLALPVTNPNIEAVLQGYRNGAIHAEEFPTAFAQAQSNLPEVQPTAAIDAYMGIYHTLRGMMGFPCVDTSESLQKNVHDALLTEAVRTIHYKFPQPEMQAVVEHMVKVADHYARVIGGRT